LVYIVIYTMERQLSRVEGMALLIRCAHRFQTGRF
jgi:hypothetical protein